MVKRVKELHIGNASYYEYENGVKVYYTRYDKTNEHHLHLNFKGGSSVQGKIMGLAHFTEHVLLNNEQLNAIVYNGKTSINKTEYMMGIKDSTLNSIIRKSLLAKGIEDKSKQENLTDDDKKKFKAEYKEAFAKEKKEIVSNFLQAGLKLFFDEVKANYTDETKFEREKTIIEREWSRYNHLLQYGNQPAYIRYIENPLSKLSNCGNLETLRCATLKDYLDYKKASYTKENLYLTIASNMNYEDFENLIISTIDKNAPSNPKTIYPDHVEKTSLNNTYLINKYDSGGMENYANILYNIVADKRLIANDIDMFIGNTLFKYLFSTTGREIYRSLRENKHYIYTSKEDYTDFHIWSVYQISLNTHINNANDALTFITKNINTMFQCYDIEKLYMFKKETSAEAIDNQINRYFVYDYWKHFPLEKREYIYKVLMDCDIDYLKNCLQKFAKHLKLNIVVSNNIDVSTLPDIDYLANLIEGKQNTTNLIKEKTKRKKEPIILDALKRFLPAVIPQNQNTTENQVNTKKA